MHARNSDIREDICRVGKRLYDKGLVAGSEGNISCRATEREFVITPSGVCKGTLTPEQLVTIAASGELQSDDLKPSSEYRLHLVGYSRRPEFAAAVHAHAPYAAAFAMAGIPIPGDALPEFRLTFGEIPLVPFAEPGTDDLAASIEPWIAEFHTFLLERHGIIAFGRGLWEAYYRVETAEHCAKILLLAGRLTAGSGAIGSVPGGREPERGECE